MATVQRWSKWGRIVYYKAPFWPSLLDYVRDELRPHCQQVKWPQCDMIKVGERIRSIESVLTEIQTSGFPPMILHTMSHTKMYGKTCLRLFVAANGRIDLNPTPIYIISHPLQKACWQLGLNVTTDYDTSFGQKLPVYIRLLAVFVQATWQHRRRVGTSPPADKMTADRNDEDWR